MSRARFETEETLQQAALQSRVKSAHLKKDSRERIAAWCAVDFGDKLAQALVAHVGRGRFVVLKDNQDGQYVGNIVDASSILSCDAKK